ncbi:cytochrome C oxidase subunit IV family protein [Mycobacterium sp. Aquia_216]|uniref:cytochrome C oxidase subunit IV family protein n=1 Tax=Mycobacterium sp. Aquia_216 TaxID=2991729 RepID=UPI002279FEBB|nr:cytochrome C oxidase subunit IV family protein [Mycobacterium sp. Aquia_216]WAJ43351.1 cytochrome C oxidase subunit IV family protein [Mycobacterium sp. Aquia_216]
MTTLLRTPATAVWVILVAATGVSWALGTQHGMPNHQLASVIILLIAFIKVRLVGLYFMELREAPNVLRGLFEAYCLIVCALLLGVFIFA